MGDAARHRVRGGPAVGFFWFFVFVNTVVLGGLVGLAFLNPVVGAVIALPCLVLPFVVPALRERRDRRRAAAVAGARLRARADPVTLAFAIGGPGRVADVIIADGPARTGQPHRRCAAPQ
jgi:hypothetical protein